MATAFVLGNGISRQKVNLNALRPYGKIYGCNALYREFEPDVLVAADKPISEQIQHSGYALRHCFYTRKPLDGLGANRIPEDYWGFSSGQAACGIAALDGNVSIYLIGFDLGGVNDRFNNVYADTEFYKRSIDRPTYTGNWVNQILQVAKAYPHVNFIRVTGSSTAVIKDFAQVRNIQNITIEQFCETFGF